MASYGGGGGTSQSADGLDVSMYKGAWEGCSFFSKGRNVTDKKRSGKLGNLLMHI